MRTYLGSPALRADMAVRGTDSCKGTCPERATGPGPAWDSSQVGTKFAWALVWLQILP